jgi:L-ribulose-5-phosphate 3-epimerase
MNFGILQGRLSPAPAGRPQAFPWTTWADEFARARALGFDTIEWLITAGGHSDNPLLIDGGDAQILRAADRAGLKVSSVCADCFIPLPLIGVPDREQRERVDLLAQIVRSAACIGARVVVLPLLEDNAPSNDDEAAALLEAIDPVLQLAAASGVRVALETAWDGARLRELIAGAESPALGACYDIGNAAPFGLDAPADLRALGPLVIAVHIKDRRRTGESVALGEGDADLAGAFAALDQIAYAGPAVLETPVGADPSANASRNLSVAQAHASRSVGTTS